MAWEHTSCSRFGSEGETPYAYSDEQYTGGFVLRQPLHAHRLTRKYCTELRRLPIWISSMDRTDPEQAFARLVPNLNEPAGNQVLWRVLSLVLNHESLISDPMCLSTPCLLSRGDVQALDVVLSGRPLGCKIRLISSIRLQSRAMYFDR